MLMYSPSYPSMSYLKAGFMQAHCRTHSVGLCKCWLNQYINEVMFHNTFALTNLKSSTLQAKG